MSAWIVSKKHIDLMVAGHVSGTRDCVLAPTRRSKDRLGQMLVDECVKSVSYRYPDDDVQKGELPGPIDAYYLKPYKFEHPKYLPTAAELYKAVDCYVYQSCEHTGWEESAAFQLCERIRRRIEARSPEARRMRAACKSGDHNARCNWAEWEAAPWGFDTEEIAVCYARSHPEGLALLRAVAAASGPRFDETPRKALNDWLQEQGVTTDVIDLSYAERMGLIAA